MGTMSGIKAGYGLWGVGGASGTNVTGTARIGTTPTEVSLTGSDIIYSFKVTANAANDVATFTLSTGVVTQTTGTPVILDGDGKDFEGVALPSSVTGSAIQIKRNQTIGDGDTIAVTSTSVYNPDIELQATDNLLPLMSPIVVTGTISFTFLAPDDWVEVIVAAKSS